MGRLLFNYMQLYQTIVDVNDWQYLHGKQCRIHITYIEIQTTSKKLYGPLS